MILKVFPSLDDSVILSALQSDAEYFWSVVLSRPFRDSCHTPGAGKCMCIYKTFAAPENNEGEKQKLCLHYAIELCVFASLYNLKKKKKIKKNHQSIRVFKVGLG